MPDERPGEPEPTDPQPGDQWDTGEGVFVWLDAIGWYPVVELNSANS